MSRVKPDDGGWRARYEAIEKWAEKSTCIDVDWKNQARGHGKRGAFGELLVTRSQTEGTPDVRQTITDAGDILEEVHSDKVITIQFRITSRSQKPWEFAHVFADRARASLRKRSALLFLCEGDLAFVDAEDIITLDAPWQDRIESVAEFSFRLRYREVVVDNAGEAGPIEAVEITPTLNNVNEFGPEFTVDADDNIELNGENIVLGPDNIILTVNPPGDC